MEINGSVREQLSERQTDNLLKLAMYLLREKPTDFDMSTYRRLPNREQPAYVCGCRTECGFVGCAIGHGPQAGIPAGTMDMWIGYSRREFIPDNTSAWAWCFAPFWSDVDNSAEGAALRILYFLRSGLPNEAEGIRRWGWYDPDKWWRAWSVYALAANSLKAWVNEHVRTGLLRKWREHIADVYDRRGRSDVYVPLEVMHTCCGCGAGSGMMVRGLCSKCNEQYEDAINGDANDADDNNP